MTNPIGYRVPGRDGSDRKGKEWVVTMHVMQGCPYKIRRVSLVDGTPLGGVLHAAEASVCLSMELEANKSGFSRYPAMPRFNAGMSHKRQD